MTSEQPTTLEQSTDIPQPPQPQAQPQPQARRPTAPGQRSGPTADGRIPRSRAAAIWVGVIVSALLLIGLIVFLAQNQGQVTTHFLGFDGRLSLALTILLSAVIGALLAAIPGTVRIVQLRNALKRAASTGR